MKYTSFSVIIHSQDYHSLFYRIHNFISFLEEGNEVTHIVISQDETKSLIIYKKLMEEKTLQQQPSDLSPQSLEIYKKLIEEKND